MPEQKIVITIDDEGRINAKTDGFKGASCLDALDELLDLNGVVCNLIKSDEFYQQQVTVQKRTQEIKGKL